MIVLPFTVMIGATPKLTVKELGGFLKVIVASAGAADQGRMDCLDDAVTEEMKSRGLTLDVRSRIAFAANLVQVRTFNAVDKLIVCTDKTFLKEGATIEELVRALTAIGSTARDIIAILQNLRAAGALEAELEVI